jgi:hypothetical protein
VKAYRASRALYGEPGGKRAHNAHKRDGRGAEKEHAEQPTRHLVFISVSKCLPNPPISEGPGFFSAATLLELSPDRQAIFDRYYNQCKRRSGIVRH